MAAHRDALDDHPLLTARHVDALTEAVRSLTRVVTKTNDLMQQQLRLMIERSPRGADVPMPPLHRQPTVDIAGIRGTRASAKPQAPRHRRR